MPIEQLQKQWDGLAPHKSLHAALSFVDGWLVLGAATRLAIAKRGAPASGRSESFDRERISALLCAAYECPPNPSVLRHIELAIAKHRAGDAILASMHLAMTGLWPLKEPKQAAYRLFMAEGLMKAGLTARDLVRALGHNDGPPDSLERRYNPDEPRIPAGNGIVSGRWGDGSGEPAPKNNSRDRERRKPAVLASSSPDTSPFPHPDGTTATDIGRGSPAGAQPEPIPHGGEKPVRLAVSSSDISPFLKPQRSTLVEIGTRLAVALLMSSLREGVRILDHVAIPDTLPPAPLEGPVPGYSNLRYTWDRYDRNLAVLGRVGNHWKVFLDEIADSDGVVKDQFGNPVARAFDSGVLFHTPFLQSASHVAKLQEDEENLDAEIAAATALAYANAATRPKLCPNPVSETQNWKERAILYQMHVTGLQRGLQVILGGTRFDGCRDPDGPLLEAKSNFENMIGPDGDAMRFFLKSGGVDEWDDQMKRQSKAAAGAGMTVEWHVQNRRVAHFMQERLAHKYTNVTVIWDPFP